MGYGKISHVYFDVLTAHCEPIVEGKMVLTYGEAERLYNSARSQKNGKPLANNTRLHRLNNGDFAVRLHDTDIIVINRDNRYTLNTGGWRTYTTKERINRFSPARIWQANNIWYIGTQSGERIFCEGIVVDRNGEPLNPDRLRDPKGVERVKRKLDRKVNEYINGFVAHVITHGLPEPSGGDCWGCFFQRKDAPRGHIYGTTMGVDHFFSHMEEDTPYYVPSLVWNAIRTRGYRDPQYIWHIIANDAREKRNPRMLRDILRSYFKKLKPAMLEHMMQEVQHG